MMELGEIDSAIRRMLGEALGPIKEQLGEIKEQLSEHNPAACAEYLTIRETSQVAGVAPGTVRRWVREGKLVSCRAGRSLCVRREDLELFMSGGAAKAEGVIDFKSRAAELLGDG